MNSIIYGPDKDGPDYEQVDRWGPDEDRRPDEERECLGYPIRGEGDEGDQITWSFWDCNFSIDEDEDEDQDENESNVILFNEAGENVNGDF